MVIARLNQTLESRCTYEYLFNSYGLILIFGGREATKDVQNIALDNNFAIPGDPAFPLNQVWASICFPINKKF